MKTIYDKIKSFETIIIHGHIHPDGDCYGSQLGLKDVIVATFPQKKVYVVGEKNTSLVFVGSMEQIEDSLYSNALSIVVDCGTEAQISDHRFKLAKEIIRIDHHVLMDNYSDYHWVDNSFGSCSEMVYLLKDKFNMNLTSQGALALYVGIVSDSGNFSFDRTSPLTFKTAAALLSFGLDIVQISYHLHKKNLDYFRCQAYICQNLVTDQGFAYVKIDQKTLEKLNFDIHLFASLVNTLSNLEDHPVWAFFIEQKNGTVKVRLRSRGPKINSIANHFGGGGHLRACGIILDSWKPVALLITKVQSSILEFNKIF